MRISDWSSDVCSSDLPGLAAELGVDRLDRLAVALRAAVAAALAGRLVDDDAGGAHLLLAALAQPAGLVGALLVVDDDRHARHLAQLALHLVERVAVADGHARGEVLDLLVLLDRKSTRLNSSH